MEECRRCYVSGKVQGVFYRASTKNKAEQLGISGYAKNLPDSRVEVIACGTSKALTEFIGWLWQGPPHAQVVDIDCKAYSRANQPDFPVSFKVL